MKVVRAIASQAAQIAGLAAAAIQLISAGVWPLTADEAGTLNAVVVAVLGLLTACAVSEEKAVPFVAGLVQAVLACGVSFGLGLDPRLQSTIMAFVATGTALWVHTQVGRPAFTLPAPGRHQYSRRTIAFGDDQADDQ